eukprot:14354714-Heterocapsa_arctica.AAC.1
MSTYASFAGPRSNWRRVSYCTTVADCHSIPVLGRTVDAPPVPGPRLRSYALSAALPELPRACSLLDLLGQCQGGRSHFKALLPAQVLPRAPRRRSA